jgi:hypothetical protein
MANITNFAPAHGGTLGADREAARWTPITFDVAALTASHAIAIWAKLGTDPYWTLLVYDGAAFQPLFADHSSVVENAGVFSFTLLPTGGWWDPPSIEVVEFEAATEV